jgi:hypothetical protein
MLDAIIKIMVSNILKVLIPFLFGVLFISSYFFAQKNEFFHFLAYFPRQRTGSIKVGSLVFGFAFIIVSLINLFLIL